MGVHCHGLQVDIKSPHKMLTPHIQSNLCITTTRGTKFLWLLWPSGHYREGLCIRAKTVNSDICSLYKGSIIFHLITHDTDKNKSRMFSFETKNYAVINNKL